VAVERCGSVVGPRTSWGSPRPPSRSRSNASNARSGAVARPGRARGRAHRCRAAARRRGAIAARGRRGPALTAAGRGRATFGAAEASGLLHRGAWHRAPDARRPTRQRSRPRRHRARGGTVGCRRRGRGGTHRHGDRAPLGGHALPRAADGAGRAGAHRRRRCARARRRPPRVAGVGDPGRPHDPPLGLHPGGNDLSRVVQPHVRGNPAGAAGGVSVCGVRLAGRARGPRSGSGPGAQAGRGHLPSTVVAVPVLDPVPTRRVDVHLARVDGGVARRGCRACGPCGRCRGASELSPRRPAGRTQAPARGSR
jgi:hypothetical protein